MENKKIILKSFLVTVVYFLLSNIYFFDGYSNPISKNIFRQAFEMSFTLPAIIIFGVGFGSGRFWSYFAAIIVFLVLWIFFLGATFLYYRVKDEVQNIKTSK